MSKEHAVIYTSIIFRKHGFRKHPRDILPIVVDKELRGLFEKSVQSESLTTGAYQGYV